MDGERRPQPRNLDGRIEVVFPVETPHLRRAIRDTILFPHLRDTAQLRRMNEKGLYERVLPQPGTPARLPTTHAGSGGKLEPAR